MFIFSDNFEWTRFLRKYGTIIAAILLFGVLSFTAPNFFTVRNFFTLLRQMSIITIFALGFTFIFSAGGFDMSVGNTIGLVKIIFAIVLVSTESFWLAVLIALLSGSLIGLINGILVVVIGLPDFIGTFGVGAIAYGIKMLITEGNPMFIREAPDIFYSTARGFLGPIPYPVIIMVIVLLISIVVLGKTKFGRKLYAIGGNTTAAKYAGIKVKKNRVLTFVISGITVGLGAIIMTSRFGSAQPLAGEGYLLDIIAINFLSITMLGEGEPTALGTFVGAFIIAILNNGLTLLDVPYYYQDITQGAVLILAVMVSVILGQELKLDLL